MTDAPRPGDEVALVTDKDEFVAYGLYNPESNITVRLYSWDLATRLDEEFWSRRLDDALRLRREMLRLDAPDAACRLVYSEADRLSGLIVDRYADWLIVQFTSLALAKRQDILLRLLQQKLSPAGIWLRTERGIREAEGLEQSDGPLTEAVPPRPLFIAENGLRFGVDIVEGQKTGLFLDQRDNRAQLARYVTGPRALDLFCYTGGFALNLARLDAVREVLAVDASESALTLARANAELNGLAHKLRFEKTDAFKRVEELCGAGERYDCIILDPPKLARHRKSVPEALRAYHRLNRIAAEMVVPGGLLVTCSCSGHVDRQAFTEMLSGASNASGRHIQILESRGQAPDHPTSVLCAEGDYLQCYICRVV